jgi:hypothetical protein
MCCVTTAGAAQATAGAAMIGLEQDILSFELVWVF